MAETRVDTIVRGGQVVTSPQVFDSAIAISGEKIVSLGPEELLPPADTYIDAVHTHASRRKGMRR